MTRLACLLVWGALICGGCDRGASPVNVTRQGCEAASCHGPSGEASGIELAHPGSPLSCTDCRGGDSQAVTAQAAHVAPAPAWVAELPQPGYLKNLAVQQLDDVADDYLRFINPGDLRVATQSCGSASPSAEGGSCHQGLVDSTARSVMNTFVGHFNAPRFEAGLQGRDSVVGALTIASSNPGAPPRGAVESVERASLPPADADLEDPQTHLDHYLNKNCTRCHSANFGPNDAPGNFRSSGCTSCHMTYAERGQSASSDPSRVRDLRAHPERHELTTSIPSGQCETCHHQGGRIGLVYRGVIEWGFDASVEEVLGVSLPEAGDLHGRPRDGYYQASADPRWPADLHFDAGMQCVDCHVGRDVHGDGWLYNSSKFQVAVRCENCHGNIDTPVVRGAAAPPLVRGGEPAGDCQPTAGDPDGVWNCAGDNLPLTVEEGGRVVLKLAIARDGRETLEIPQVHRRLEAGSNPFMNDAMGRYDSGFSHTEVLECSTCHTAYRQYCFGCHVTMDFSRDKVDPLSGLSTPGLDISSRDWTSLDLYFVGQNHRGKIGSFCPSMQLFMGVDDPQGEPVYRDRIRRTATGKPGFNWAIDEPHTVSKRPQPCSRCHTAPDGSQTDARESFGFGTGRFELTDDQGQTHDLTQLLDAEGRPIVDFAHEGQGAVPLDVIERALDIQVCAEGDRQVRCNP